MVQWRSLQIVIPLNCRAVWSSSGIDPCESSSGREQICNNAEYQSHSGRLAVWFPWIHCRREVTLYRKSEGWYACSAGTSASLYTSAPDIFNMCVMPSLLSNLFLAAPSTLEMYREFCVQAFVRMRKIDRHSSRKPWSTLTRQEITSRQILIKKSKENENEQRVAFVKETEVCSTCTKPRDDK